ncbi:MAG: metal-dependent hydrolase [Polyangiaceae bacterium]|nr:metal-dependent hydrolase [Polyangiaceae bacterium]
MDPLSQAALGAAAAVLAQGRDDKITLPWVVALGAAGGMAADLDVLIRSSEDPLLAIEFHRHFTHSLAFIPWGGAIAFLPFLLVARIRLAWRKAFILCLLGYLTHGPLDALTTYGTQLFWPWSDQRVALSIVSVVDPLVTLPLIVGLTLTLIYKTRRPTVWASFWMVAYLCLGGVQHWRATQLQEELIAARGHRATRSTVLVGFMNQLTWRSLYEEESTIRIDALRVPYWGEPCVQEGGMVALWSDENFLQSDRLLRAFQLMHWFSDDWVGQVPGHPDWLGDLRYSGQSAGVMPLWAVSIDFPNEDYDWVRTRLERDLSFEKVWDRIVLPPGGPACVALSDLKKASGF